MSTTTADLAQYVPNGRSLFGWALVLNTELILVIGYLTFSAEPTTDWLLLTFPFVWINVAGLVFRQVRPAPATQRRQLVGVAVAVGYLLLLGWVGGVIGLGGQGAGLRATLAAPPGFAPTIVYSGSPLAVVLMPWKVAGYLTLSYLVYVTVLDASGGAVGGIVGLFSCVSCTLPVIASVVGGFAGAGATLYQAAMLQSYGLSTVVFLVSVGLLYAVHRFDVTIVGWLRS